MPSTDGKKSPKTGEARRDLTEIAVGRSDHRVVDLADLPNQNTGSVSRWLTIVDRHLAIDPGYRTELDRLEKQMTQSVLEIVRL